MNRFLELLNELNINYTDDMLKKLELYYNFLVEYNSHTNLTGITEKDEVYLKHFYDSLTICKIVDLSKINNLLDIGTGAGFPGMVIKIFFPDVDITLLDSNNKKTTFLKLLSDKLDIKVNIVNKRAEDYQEKLNSFDIVTSRAVAYMDIISSLTLPFININGKVVLFKGDLVNEEAILVQHKDDLSIDKYEINDVTFDNNIRNLVTLTKTNETKNIKSYKDILNRSKKWRI